MSWWLWVVFGLALAGLEIVAPAWVFLGFAVGALGVGGVLWLGWAPTTALQILVFALMSLVGWAVLRAAFGTRRGQVKRIERDINEN